MAKRKSIIGLLIQIAVVIVILSSFGVTWSQIIALDWFGDIGNLFINFFTN